jgi:hypothetical protein
MIGPAVTWTDAQVFFRELVNGPVGTRRTTRLAGTLAVLAEIRGGGLFGMLSLVTQFVYWSRIVSSLNQEHA